MTQTQETASTTPSLPTEQQEEKPATSIASAKFQQHRVLTVGDGNFSYSLALAKQHNRQDNDTILQLTATSYDSYDELVAKYPECKRICAQLKELGASVLHRVDATNIRESLVAAGAEQLKFDAVVFNHPHCGEENVRRHQSLLSHFYASALEVLQGNEEDEESGILLTLAEGQPERWQAVERGLKAGLRLHRQIDDVDNDEVFGLVYERKRHQNGKSFHQVTLHGERKKQASTLFIFRRQKATEAENKVTTTAPVVSVEENMPVSRKRKAESELPLGFACTQCERSFKSAQGLRTHVHMVHELESGATKKILLPCEFCDRTFKKEDARRQHQLAKHGKDPLIKPDCMKVSKVIAALVVMCVALLTPAASSKGITDVVGDSTNRHLRQESAQFASKPKETGAKKDSTNPLQRRDQALVSAHRVYDPVSGLACALVGECMACPTSEKDESFCRETGYRQELDCPRPKDPKDAELLTKPEDERETRFKACSPADTARPGVAVVKFEAMMSVILAVSVILLRRERGKHMSSFDMRKDPRQRTGLLGSGASSDKGTD
ncbi:hypothetical protein JG688_00011486 [Phytophthora aleatoria]|uniref:C2H2-type domain-containing protein n=1 Tax=Phytophthora aleatoria TaxID=2496075 RepID=A0A8J5ICK7_9STRA|nr:hypothetical protein JG688_00011486 [Phytophthora aleatoria]